MRAVLERDFLAEASRPRAFLVRTVLAAMVVAIAGGLLWVGLVLERLPADVVGARVFQGGGLALVAMMALVTPPLVVGSVLAERQQETLPLVLASPVGPFSFALAKLLARMGTVLAVAFAAFPCFALATLFGGVGGGDLLGLAGLLLAVIVEMAAWSLWASGATRRLAPAVMLAFLVPLLRWVLTLVVAVLVVVPIRTGRGPGFAPSAAASLLVTSTPLGSLVPLFQTDILRFGRVGLLTPFTGGGLGWQGFLITNPWVPYLAFSVLLAASLVIATGLRLRRESEPEMPRATTSSPRRRRLFRGAPGIGNPLLWKETRLLNTAGTRPLYYRVLAVMFLAFLVGFGSLVSSTPHAAFGFLGFHVAMLCVVGTVGGAATLGHDRTQGSYDLLRASPLTPRQILRGKAAGVLTGLAFLAVIPVCHLLLSLLLGVISFGELAAGCFLLVAIPAFWTGAGLAFGIHFARPQTAMARAAFALAMLGVGFPALGAMAEPILRKRFQADIGPWIWDASPPVAVYDGLSWLHWELLRVPSSRYYPVWHPAGVVWCCLYAAYALFLWFFLPRLLARRLDREKDEG